MSKPAGIPEIISSIDLLMKDHKNIIDRLTKIDKILETLSIDKGDKELSTVAAKIINDISMRIDECRCNKEIIDFFSKNKAVQPDIPEEKRVDTKDQTKPFSGKYKFPNYGVGNEELGSSKSSSAIRLPPPKK